MLTREQLQAGWQRTIFLEELPTLGRLPALEDFLTRGRDYGVQLTLGIQDIRQMNAAYGHDLAVAIIGSFAFRGCLKCHGPTARWCSQEVSEQDVRWDQEGYRYSHRSQQGQGQSLDKNNHRVWLNNNSLSGGFTHNVNQQERI